MGELMALIQAHLDRYGVSRAEFSRRAGMAPQTVQNWISRPGTFPEPQHLRGVARVIGKPYEVVLKAALKDAGYSGNEAEPLTPGSGLRASAARIIDELEVEDRDEGREEA